MARWLNLYSARLLIDKCDNSCFITLSRKQSRTQTILRMASKLFFMIKILFWILITCLHVSSPVQAGKLVNYSSLFVPVKALATEQLAVIVNDSDPQSVSVAKYYQAKRKIPATNIIHVQFKAGGKQLTQEEFKAVKDLVDAITPKNIQAYALSWTFPFRVDCMSITTAFAKGFDPKFCAKGCKTTASNPYFANFSEQPFTDFKWRPTMMLAGENVEQVKMLIDRGVEADFSEPQGSAYLLKTSDQARSSRALIFKETAKKLRDFWPVNYLEQDALKGKRDVMFYFTGMVKVPDINTNHFLPGAIADHLTSTGGVLTGGSQMSILEWLKAGATGSYGTVVEPCNFPAKFPNPEVVLHFYLRGSTLIEAYWKSVEQPGQGLFIGEPLAKPFASR